MYITEILEELFHDGEEFSRRRLGGGSDGPFTFLEIYYLFLFITALWLVGKACERIALPSVVGEILVGLILGPELLDIAPKWEALALVGECGLILLVIEAGLEVDLKLLNVIGSRGVTVAICGSMIPVGMGFGLASAVGVAPKAAFAIGCCLAPTSMGIAVNVLKKGGVLNTTIGQLVIASAVLDDIISLVLLGVVAALENPTPFKLAQPLVVSGLFLAVFGYIAFVFMPEHLPELIEKIPHKFHDGVYMGLVFTLSLLMIPATHYAGSSYLLGSFLAGLCFCHNHHVHHVWGRQMKRIMQWLLRLFFGGTIAFAVPIKDVWTGKVISHALMYFSAIVGKFATCVWAPGFPRKFYDGMKLGAAMSAWGEFAFILATMSESMHIINKQQFSSVVMAILASVIVGPILLGYAINKSNEKKRETVKQIQQELDDLEINERDTLRRYWKITMKTETHWGFLWDATTRLEKMGIEMLDHRLDYAGKKDEKVTLTFIARDMNVDADGSGDISQEEMEDRRFDISREAFKICGNREAQVAVSKWTPRRICRKTSKTVKAKSSNKLFLHPRFPHEEKISWDASALELAKQFLNHIPCMAVIAEDESVIGFVTKSNLTRGLVKNGMNLSHGYNLADYMTPVERMVTMSKNSTPEDILRSMSDNSCKHMPLTDDFSGMLLFIADIRDIVSSITSKSTVVGKTSTETIAARDTGRDSIWVSKTGKPIDFRTLESRMNLLEAAENMNINPFSDGFHVVFDQHRFSLIDGGAPSFDMDNPIVRQASMDLIRQTSMETWPPPGTPGKGGGKKVNAEPRLSLVNATDFFNYMQAAQEAFPKSEEKDDDSECEEILGNVRIAVKDHDAEAV